MFRKLVLLVSFVLTSAAGHAAPTITTHLEAGAENSAFFDVNNAGTVVGYSTFGGVPRAFTWTEGGGFVALAGPAGSHDAFASGISAAGTIVGSYADVAGGAMQGFVFDGVSYAPFNIVGANNTYLRAISPDGRYITGYYDADDVIGQGFIWDASTATLTLIGAGGADTFTIAQGVSDAGLVVGSDASAAGNVGFTYDVASAVRTEVTLPGFVSTRLRAIDSSGVISGWGRSASGQNLGFTGYPGAIETFGAAFASTFLEGSNDAGWLVGQAFDDTGTGLALLLRPNAMPVPGTLALSAFALGLLALRRRATA